ncbi:phenylalanine--tRNA ligase subunit beta [Pedobacter flavus]|uniref:Phenylalanine--tRNA ligase beta subunit n=1 Tax=Pedobacter flavus TaxID=3113906 RepID=A0ABU7H232_9SPHI|nr:phenylalanine--tRNA ligase subunit beta [Pedobacter sp. VNH31]MEE1885122.1 phenylalanine--tRNA ligase subunit beta [Pedobacter sp. VNH31]
MKISYNWLQQFFKSADSNPLLTKTPQEISLILTDIGLEVESLEKVQPIIGGLEGLIIGKVLTREQHPNADRLSVTTVDLGAGDPVQIVCGAPNVAAGQTVVVAPVGCTVYPLNGEPFKITKSKIRGEVSEGMICAEDEIGLGKSHDGIMVLPEDAVVGTLAKHFFKLNDDYLFEIGLTPNRSDAASHLGVARDLAAYFRTNITLPDLSAFKVDNTNLNIAVKIENESACKRYTSLSITGVKVEESPEWIQEKLKIIGLRPINNIVDITNYVLHELGQPLHAFDADKIKGSQINVKNFKTGTPFVTLDGVERKLDAEDLIIADAENPLCLAGVFGGLNSGVSEETTNVFLESAYFDAVSIRKSSKRHGLKTDASFRFERGTDPEITEIALKRAAILITEIAGGKISSEISDIYPNPVKPVEIEVSYQEINDLIGFEIPADEISTILKSLGIEILIYQQNQLKLSVPSFKVDVTRPCDITEEVLRIYGYNSIPIPSKINASLGNTVRPDRELTQHTIADLLSAQGFAEIWCNSLTKGGYALNKETVVEILNPLSSDLSIMRQSLLHPALESVAYNQNHRINDVKFYEFGKVYHKTESGYAEQNHLLLLMSGAQESERWTNKTANVNFYSIKGSVEAILGRLGLLNFQVEELENSQNAEYGLKYFRGKDVFVEFGAVSSSIRKSTDVEREVFYAQFNWDLILSAVAKLKIKNKEVSKFPVVRRDLSLLIDNHINFENLKTIVFKSEKKLVKDVNIFDVFLGTKTGSLPEGKKSYAISITLQDESQTLTDKQIDAVMQKIIHNLAKEVNAEIR